MVFDSASQVSDYAPIYERLADRIRREIVVGKHAPGEKLPPTKALCERYGVSPLTMQRALAILRKAGMLVRTPGQGTFVKAVKTRRARPLIGVTFPCFTLPMTDLSETAAPTHFRVYNGILMAAAALSVDIQIFPLEAMFNSTPEGVDGVIVVFVGKDSEPFLKKACDFKFPTLYIDLLLPEWRKRFFHVNWNARQGGQIIAERLVTNNRRRVVFLSTYEPNPEWHPAGLIEGFRKIADKTGLQVQWRLGPMSRDERLNPKILNAHISRLLRNVEAFDAIVAMDEVEANTIHQWATRRGLRSPDDYELIAPVFHKHEPAPPELLALKVPLWELGTDAIKTMLDLLNNRFVPHNGVWVTPTLERDVLAKTLTDTTTKIKASV